MHYKAVFCTGRDTCLVERIQQLRRVLFVEQCNWNLFVDGDREVDQFDTTETVHLALFRGRELGGTFRATRTDRPYLAAEIFPSLAIVSPYPHRADIWEISRFGVLGTGDMRQMARINYALMFWFARRMGACGLVAIADLAHERFLRSFGIRTRRYGPPQNVGVDRNGGPVWAVAGEIPIAHQSTARLSLLATLLNTVEVEDATDILGHTRVSA